MDQKGSASFAVVVLIIVVLFAAVAYVFIGSDRFTNRPTGNVVISPSPVPTPSPSEMPASPSAEVKSPSPQASSKVSASPVVQKNQITVTLSGKVYRDANCDEVMQNDENGLANVDVRIDQQPNYITIATVKTDSNGNFVYKKTIGESEYISLGPSLVAPDGYKIHGNNQYSGLSKTFPEVTINFPLVPIESINQGLCPVPQ